MATESTTGLYPFDPTGESDDNYVFQEQQVINTPGRDDFYFIIPKAAPFFVSSLELRMDGESEFLVEGVDYAIGHWFIEAMHEVAKPVAGSIRFFNRDLNGIIILNYQTIGGQWGFSDQAILEELSNRQINPITRAWAQIDTLPYSFPPLEHDQDVTTFTGWEEVVDAVGELATAVGGSSEGSLQDHVDDKSNPHSVTKTQVGLADVRNYPVANESESRAMALDSRYMTPKGVGQALDQFYQDELADYIGGDGPTAEQVGLGDVVNAPFATETQAIDGTSSALYMAPSTSVALLEDRVLGPLNDHIDDQNNPHGLTADDIGAIDESVLTDRLEGYLPADEPAMDAKKAYGLTRTELRENILTGTANNSELLAGYDPNSLLDLYRFSLQSVYRYSINGENAGSWLRLISRPTQKGEGDVTLPSGHISFLITGHHDDGEGLIQLHLGEPDEEPTARTLNGRDSSLELRYAFDSDDIQTVWVHSTGNLEAINVTPLAEVQQGITQMEDVEDPQTQETINGSPEDIVIVNPLAELAASMEDAFTDAIDELS